MDYRDFIRTLVADIINKKRDYSDITSRRDFFYVQYALLKMGRIEKVIEMGKLARAWNLRHGVDLNAKRNPYKTEEKQLDLTSAR